MLLRIFGDVFTSWLPLGGVPAVVLVAVLVAMKYLIGALVILLVALMVWRAVTFRMVL